MIGEQLARDPSAEASLTPPQYNHSTWGPLVSQEYILLAYIDWFNWIFIRRSDEPTGRLALVFELMDMNMYEAIKGRRHYLPEQRVKYYMYQVLKAIDHMHRNGIFHRDIKP